MAKDITSATFSDLMAAGGFEAREAQKEYAHLVSEALSDLGKIALIHADTGLGKSLGYLLPAMQHAFSGVQHPRIIIATHSHALMSQLLSSANGVMSTIAVSYGLPPLSAGILLGRMNFVSPDRVAAATYGRTLSNDEAEAVACLSGWTDTIAQFEEEHGGLPCGLTTAQVCMTPDCKNADLDQSQQVELSKDIVITTHAMVAVDMIRGNSLLGIEERKAILIVDEADALVEQLQEWTQRRLNLIRAWNALASEMTAKKLAPLNNLVNQVSPLLAGRRHEWNNQSSTLALAILDEISKVIKSTQLDDSKAIELERQTQSIRATTVGLGQSVTGQPAIIGMTPWFTRNFTKYATKAYQSVLLTSGTLSITNDPDKGTAWIRHDLGITQSELGEVAMFSPSRYGEMSLTLAGPDFPAIYKGRGPQKELSEEWLERVALQIANARGRVIVLTASHKESHLLAMKLANDDTRPTFIHRRGTPLRELAGQFVESCQKHGRGIMITAAGHTGLNITDKSGRVGFDHLFISRIAFAQPDHESVEALADFLMSTGKKDLRKSLQQQAFMRSLNSAIRQMRQALGRGIRSPDDKIAVSICDPRFPLSHDLSSKHAALRNIIPSRFGMQYRNANVMCVQPQGAGEHPDMKEVFF